jgi:MtN3 and saliva related transmembrane protein
MTTSEIMGYIAATLTTSAFIPQAIKVIQTKETEGISLWMYIIFTTGVLFWLIYGLIQNIYPIIIANAITLIFASIILLFKLKETKPQK